MRSTPRAPDPVNLDLSGHVALCFKENFLESKCNVPFFRPVQLSEKDLEGDGDEPIALDEDSDQEMSVAEKLL